MEVGRRDETIEVGERVSTAYQEEIQEKWRMRDGSHYRVTDETRESERQ